MVDVPLDGSYKTSKKMTRSVCCFGMMPLAFGSLYFKATLYQFGCEQMVQTRLGKSSSPSSSAHVTNTRKFRRPQGPTWLVSTKQGGFPTQTFSFEAAE